MPDKDSAGPETQEPSEHCRFCVEYTRRFNRPSGLESGEQVFLKMESGKQVIDKIQLNGHELANFQINQLVEISSLLAPANELVIRMGDRERPVCLDAEINLWIGHPQ